MDKEALFDPRDFLLNVRFSPKEIDQRNPAARRVWTGGLFVSHAGLDSIRIREDIIRPVVEQRFPVDGHFLHNKGSGGPEIYRNLIQAALNFCDKFMVVVSQNSVGNAWVRAEVEWALRHHRPIIAVLIDDSILAELLPPSDDRTREVSSTDFCIVDFRRDTQSAQHKLASILDQLLRMLPYTGIYSPR
jgi:hypothetical protein